MYNFQIFTYINRFRYYRTKKNYTGEWGKSNWIYMNIDTYTTKQKILHIEFFFFFSDLVNLQNQRSDGDVNVLIASETYRNPLLESVDTSMSGQFKKDYIRKKNL